MHRLSREVRFAIDPRSVAPPIVAGSNGFAGKPPITGIGQVYYSLAVTVAGEPDASSGYLLNIRCIDNAVRRHAIPLIHNAMVTTTRPDGGGLLLQRLFSTLRDEFTPHRLDGIELRLSPQTSISASLKSPDDPTPMIYLRHTFEFAASHRLHDTALSDEANREVFGKCNNPHGHGHNYQVMVTLCGEPDANGFLIDFYDLEQIVDDSVIEPFDHKHLNKEVIEFLEESAARVNPSVENIAKAIFNRLSISLAPRTTAELDSITVWETPKTWCEYRPAKGGNDPTGMQAPDAASRVR